MFISQPLLRTLEHDIRSVAGTSERVKTIEPVIGGDTHQSFRIRTDRHSFFVKTSGKPDAIRMLMSESTGLALLMHIADHATPTTHTVGQAYGEAFLLMEWVEQGLPTQSASETLGALLATIHRKAQSYFGLDHDNFIGSLPQSNTPQKTWADFFIHERLEKQVREARDRNLLSRELQEDFQNLYGKIQGFFPDEPPALLHGDLWGGNYLIRANGQPVLVDPAVYCGHREVDIAMTTLFGGFDEPFYRAYQDTYPLQQGWRERLDLCNLYPLLVHLNLFGRSYLGQIETIVRRFCAS